MTENRYAILIASSKFKDSNLQTLQCTENDVDGLNEILKSPNYCNFAATYPAKNLQNWKILQKIEGILKKANKDDLVLIYYSGHGKLDSSGKLHLATVNTDISTLKTTSIPIEFIKSIIEDSKTNKVVIILDCCYSGLAGEELSRGGMDDSLQSFSSGTYILTASSGIQQSKERESEKYGVFTKHIIEGIRSWEAANQDGNITMDSLFTYIKEQMKNERNQTPMKWDLKVKGEIIIAGNGRSKKEERRKKISSLLADLYSQDIIPGPILSRSIEIIDPDTKLLSKDDILYDRLLDRLLNKSLKPNQFIHEWYKIVHREDPTIYFDKAKISHNQGKVNDALALFDKAIEINPDFVAAWDGKGNILNELGKYDEAIKAFERATELDPKSLSSWYGKGKALETLGRTAEAKVAFAKAIGIDNVASEDSMLKVTNAKSSDVGRGIARIDPLTFKEKGWKAGDVIIIQGKKKTAVLIWPGYPEDKTKGTIGIDGNIRSNAGVNVEDFVLVRTCQAVPAEYVVFAPTVPLRITGGEEYLKKYMEGRAITRGDIIEISVMGRKIELMAVEVAPNNDAVVIMERTKMKVSEKPAAV